MIGAARARGWRAALPVAFAALFQSCNDGMLHGPSPSGGASVSLVASVAAARGGPSQAFDKADALYARFAVGGDVRLEREQAFSPGGGDALVGIDVPLRELTEQVDMTIELRAKGQALFRGTARPTLSAGIRTPVEITLEPVVASVTCGGADVLQFAAYGQVVRLQGAALFATGDSLPGDTITWSASAGGVISATSDGEITALQDGDARLTCAASGVTGTRPVHVFAVVDHVQVTPPSASLTVGGTITLRATLFDSRDNVITASRPLAWGTTDASVATVSSAGVVAALTPGTARITATSGAATGTADVAVAFQAPAAVTMSATNLTGTTARLNGTVNPRTTPTQAWFEWGTSPTLDAPSSTPPVSVGSGADDVPMTADLAGLTSNTPYFFRVVASNPSTTVRGAIVRFVTPQPPSVLFLDGSFSVTPLAYTVYGSINPNGSATNAWFEFGTDTTPAKLASTSKLAVGGGTTPLLVSQNLPTVNQGGLLQPATTYFARAVASNAGGTTRGEFFAFNTGGAPRVQTASGAVFCTNTSFAGLAFPNNAPTRVWFEYANDATLAGALSTAPQDIGSFAPNGTSFFDSVAGFYFYFRAVAQNPFGTVRSPITTVHIC